MADDYLCHLQSESVERDAVLKTLDADEVKTMIFAVPSDLTEDLERELRRLESGEDSLPSNVCLFEGAAGDSNGSVRIMFQWAMPESSKGAGRALRNANRYEVNGLPAEASEGDAKLSFSCVMPGELHDASRQARLVGWVSLTGGPRRGPREGWDIRYVTLSYLMAQKAVDALGCENKPLKGDPVVKPVKG
ncbi:hypothetical protein M4914_08080 [Streptomyces somaliensis DSM 40738]|uniref:Uncharacterized protein n=1 Tax=Streptomyces somaliensis (strain ATCC 33201 / DSM 40738 / JCM 12659 / KCTC 9044 / NCTC 11332 / NRRL B-12077 / IP 733) TaxID=1134445 RepID=A0AA44DC58_STRE0|nr:hypothetical protein [Streptomyces somaliensis]MCQ0022915.1 hypothetical protein [Streptomyces somaliensis DSM 40738]NKY14161.1 hypothetical protein [Streptomyces somaliensis DSM 40738]